jgi:Nucleotide-diphospho-sugar transferase
MTVTVTRRSLPPGSGGGQHVHRLLFTHGAAAALALYLGILYSLHHHESLCHFRERDLTPDIMMMRAARSNATNANNAAKSPKAAATVGMHVPATTLSKLIVGAATTDLNDFVHALPLGSPLNGNYRVMSNGSKDVLLLYVSASALPEHADDYLTQSSNGRSIWSGVKLEEATRNCRQIKHVVSNTRAFARSHRSCVAVVGRGGRSSESFHIQKWKRPNSAKGTQGAAVVKPRSVAWNLAGRYEYIDDRSFNAGMRIVPRAKTQVLSRLEIQSYLGVFESALDALRPLAAAVANAGNDKVKGSVIVLVTNYGHSVLLRNYVCASRAVGMDTDKILVVATDRSTLELGRSLGVATFYHEQLFAGIPEGASKVYGDTQYSKVMMSKAYCVHLVSQLGYHILFQDVDIVPYQPNVLEWWIDVAKTGYDLYFQFDFSSRPNYAPWYVYELTRVKAADLRYPLTHISCAHPVLGWPTRDRTLRPATSKLSTSFRPWCGPLTSSSTTAPTRPPCIRSSASCRASSGCGSRRSSRITRKSPVRARVPRWLIV